MAFLLSCRVKRMGFGDGQSQTALSVLPGVCAPQKGRDGVVSRPLHIQPLKSDGTQDTPVEGMIALTRSYLIQTHFLHL